MVKTLGTRLKLESEVFWLCPECKHTYAMHKWQDDWDWKGDHEPPLCECCEHPMRFTVSYFNEEVIDNDITSDS
jgi:NAD-dependent SIR2 family protein deacetylase